MNDIQNLAVSVEQFVSALIQQSSITLENRDCIDYGYKAGWLEDMDVINKSEPLLKKNAARIVHEFMQLELHKPDIDDVSAATKLRDLYDCRVCAKHVMQVFTKGIMKGYYVSDTLYLFGMNDKISPKEMHEILEFLFNDEWNEPVSK